MACLAQFYSLRVSQSVVQISFLAVGVLQKLRITLRKVLWD
jgi:hypothetical protein